MKTTLFTYDSSLGKFWIRPEPAGRVQLGLDHLKLRTYPSAKAAARAVAERATGYHPWDTGASIIAPATLDKWKRPEPQRARRKLPEATE